MKTEPLLATIGIVIGWVLKSLTDYFALRNKNVKTYNTAAFFILRAWKTLFDYDRGTNYFREKKPSISEFEPWRAILASKFVVNFSQDSGNLSEAVKVLATADPTLAVRLDNTIKNILFTFKKDMASLAETDEERYAKLLYNHDQLIDFTLRDFEKVANKLASRSGIHQQYFVKKWFRECNKGTTEFNEGMEKQKELINKVTSP